MMIFMKNCRKYRFWRCAFMAAVFLPLAYQCVTMAIAMSRQSPSDAAYLQIHERIAKELSENNDNRVTDYTIDKTNGALEVVRESKLAQEMYEFSDKNGEETDILKGDTRLAEIKYPALIRRKSDQIYFKLSNRKVNPQHFQFLIPNTDACEDSNRLFMITILLSIHREAEVRSAIRDTWGSYTNVSMKLVFLFGTTTNGTLQQQLVSESERYGDIVQADFVDSYANLTYKVLMGLHWVALNCPQAKYILKSDSDNFINVPFLIKKIKSHPHDANGTIYGTINRHKKVVRDGKWAVSEQMYPMDVYPAYANGPCYVVSTNLARKLYNASQYLPYLSMEDVFITGTLVRILGATHQTLSGLQRWPYPILTSCQILRRKQVSVTKLDSGAMYDIWETMQSFPQSCRHVNS